MNLASYLAPSSPMNRSLKTILALSLKFSNWESNDIIQITQRDLQKAYKWVLSRFLTLKNMNLRLYEDDSYIDLGFVVILIRINMGCGAICGDNNAVQAGNKLNIAQHTMEILVPSLKKGSVLVTKKSIETFIELYKQKPTKFQLSPKPYLSKEDVIPNDVLIKWKLVLFGLDSDQKKYSDCLGLPEKLDTDTQQELNGQNYAPHKQETIIFHQCFIQIKRDLGRTIALPSGLQQGFQNVLKRISNFFPKMGYTQGLNFIIGYLIIIGYSQNDSFWIFVHIALNRRYLLLGLYEDGFPLSSTFIIIFKNILKRTHLELYSHIFQTLQIDTSMWVFKWFNSCFIYSFPLELVKYAWDIMIQLGSLGLVTLALSLTIELQPFLMKHQQMADACEFITSLKTLQCMNHYVNVERVVKGAFQIQILYTDFEGVQEFGGFYGSYLKQKFKETQLIQFQKGKNLPKYDQIKKSQQLLDNWYQQLNEERQIFIKTNRIVNTLDLPLPIESNQKPIKSSKSGDIEIMISQSSRDNMIGQDDKKIRRSSVDLSKNHMQIRAKKRQLLFDEINEKLDEESKSQKSKKSKVSHQSKRSRKNTHNHIENILQSVSIRQDQLDKLQKQFQVKSKKSVIINNYASPNRMVKQKEGSFNSRLPAKIPPPSKAANHSTFGLAGRNSLRLQNYDVSSVKSKNVSSKQSRIKASNISIQGQLGLSKVGRSCACKTKTQENKLSNFDKSSQLASMKDQFSDKDSVSNRNLSHTEQPIEDLKSVTGERVETYRDRVTTIGDYMINSHGPALKQKPSSHFAEEFKSKNTEMEQQIVVLPFKKVKTMKEGKVAHIEISKRQPPSDSAALHYEHEEESIESIHPYTIQKAFDPSCLHNQHHCTDEICEIESIR